MGLAGAIGREGPEDATLGAVASWRGRAGLVHREGPVRFFSDPRTAERHGIRPDRNVCGLHLAGDARIDNLDEIIAALGTRPGEATDAEILARAYRHWGDAAFARLAGDFALSLWDPATEELLLVRDHLGIRPLYVRDRGASLSFASTDLALRESGRNGPAPPALSAFLAGIPDYGEEVGAGIRRVMPGCVLRWRPGGPPRQTRYWEIAPDTETPGDPAAAFREIFEHAVAARLRGTEKIGAMLSGGLDSSSVAVVAARHRASLPVYCGVHPRTPALDETRYIESVLETGSFAPTFLDRDAEPPLAALPAVLAEQGGPVPAPGLPISRALYHRAAGDGIEILLDGHGGDEVAWHGSSRLLELAAEGRWTTLLGLLPSHCRLFGERPSETLARILQISRRTRNPGMRALRRALLLPGRLRGDPPGAAGPAWRRFLRDDVIRRDDLVDRWRAELMLPEACRRSDRANHLRALASPLFARSFEILDKTASAAGIEPRYPFCDRRLVTFCLGLPASEKFRRGQTRSILRRGLAGLLPEPVRTRQDKTNFLPLLRDGIARDHRAMLDAAGRDTGGGLGDYLDMDVVRAGIDGFLADPARADGETVHMLWRILSLQAWLDPRDQPVAHGA